jgi:hypothetical protein
VLIPSVAVRSQADTLPLGHTALVEDYTFDEEMAISYVSAGGHDPDPYPSRNLAPDLENHVPVPTNDLSHLSQAAEKHTPFFHGTSLLGQEAAADDTRPARANADGLACRSRGPCRQSHGRSVEGHGMVGSEVASGGLRVVMVGVAWLIGGEEGIARKRCDRILDLSTTTCRRSLLQRALDAEIGKSAERVPNGAFKIR